MEFSNRDVWILVAMPLALFSITVVNSQQRAKFGEACGEGLRCDSRASLSCIDSICKCLKPEEMIFDQDRGKCVVLLNERCSYTVQWTDESLECLENANCSNDGFCVCNNDHYENLEGVCTRRKNFGHNCTTNKECKEQNQLSCKDGVCSCTEAEAEFDGGSGKCVGKIGASCKTDHDCPKNSAYCSHRKICECAPNYRISKDGRCLKSYNTDCSSTQNSCWDEFACINGKCSCRFPILQSYSGSLERCVSYALGPCLEVVDGHPQRYDCPSNAECKNVSGIYECTCSKGYVEFQRQCEPAYEHPCRWSFQCDSHAGLICRNGICSCPDLKEYDFQKNECRGLVGAPCMHHQRVNGCLDRAHCYTYRGLDSGEGVCRCRDSKELTTERKCVKSQESNNEVHDQGAMEFYNYIKKLHEKYM